MTRLVYSKAMMETLCISYHRLNIKVHLVFTPVVAGESHITKTIFVIVRWYFQNWYLSIWKMINGRFLILQSLSMLRTVSTGLDAS